MKVSLTVTPKRSGALDTLSEAVGEELPEDAAIAESTTRMFAFSPPELHLVIERKEVSDGEPVEEIVTELEQVDAVERDI